MLQNEFLTKISCKNCLLGIDAEIFSGYAVVFFCRQMFSFSDLEMHLEMEDNSSSADADNDFQHLCPDLFSNEVA